MARRRINTKFLAISAAAIVGTGGAAFVAHKLLVHHDPRPLIAAGDLFAKQNEWPQAVANYGQAAGWSPKDPAVWTKLGDAQMQLRSTDRDQGSAAVKSWNHATEIDPNYLPAWQKLLTVYQEELASLEMTHRATAVMFTRTRDDALQCVRLDPSNPTIAGVPLELELRMWLDNIPLPSINGAGAGLSDAQRADNDITALSKFQTAQPEFAYWLAKAKIRQGEDALHENLPDIAYARFDEAYKAFDSSIAKHPNDVKLYLSQFDVMNDLTAYDTRPAQRKMYDQKRHEALQTAQTVIEPSNPLYPMVKTQYASLIGQADPAKAESIYRDLIAKYPTNYGLRVSLAGLLGSQPKRTDDALAVLSGLPDQPPVTMTGSARAVMDGQLTDARLTRATIRAQKLATADAVDKAKLDTAIDADIAAIPPTFLNDWQVLQAIGKIQLLQGKTRDAIQTLGHASERLKTQDPNRRDVALMLAQGDAYRMGGQATEAISLYEQALDEPTVANDPSIHIRLAQLYLSQHNRTGAAKYVDWLKQRYPYDAEVVSLEIATLDKDKDHDQIMALYNTLPEVDDAAKIRKVSVAQLIDSAPEVARLLNDVYNDHPGDAQLAFNLARADMAVDKTDEAKQVVRESLKINPNSTGLQLLDEQLNNASTAQRDATVRKSFDAIKDPALREQQLARYADETGKPAEALEHLKAAYKLAPKDSGIVADLFSHYLNLKQFSNAEPLLQPLADMDADQAHGLVFRFNYAFAKKDMPGALTIGKQLTQDFPEFSGSWSSLGQALQSVGQTEDAASKYVTALEKQGTNYVALRNLVICCYQLNRIADAQQYISQGRQRFPNDPVFRQLEIQHILDYGDPQDAITIVQNNLKATPDDRSAYLAAAEVLSRASAIMRAKGNGDGATQDLLQARDVLKSAVDRWPDDPTFVVPYASSLNATNDFAGGESVIRAFGDKPAWKDRPDMAMALAHYFQAAGKADLADAPLREAMRRSHDALPVRSELITNLISERKFDDALAELKAEPASDDVAKQRTQIYLEANRLAEAEQASRAGVKDYPQDASFQNLLALSLFRENKIDEAEGVVQAALSAEDDNAGAHYVRSMLDLRQKPPKTDEATKDLQFVLAREPGNAPAASLLSDILAAGGDIDGASHVLEAALRASPSSKDMRLKLVELYSRAIPPRWDDATRTVELGLAYGANKNDPDLLHADAMVWTRRNRGDNALAAIQAALKVAPNRPDLVHDYFGILLLNHDDQQLLDESQAVLNNPPVPWWAYSSRGTAMAHLGDLAGAAAQFDLALTAAGATNSPTTIDVVVNAMVQDLGPAKTMELVTPRAQNSVTWKLESVALQNRYGDKKQAMALLDQVMDALNGVPAQEQVSTLSLAGSLYLNAKPPAVEKSIAAYKRLLDLQPTNAMALNNLAYLLSEMSNPPQPAQALVYSQRAFDEVRAQGRIEPLIFDTQGWVLILDGRVDDGIDVLHQAINAAAFPEAHYHLGEAYLRKQMPVDAQREFLAADELIDDAVSSKKTVDPALKGKVRVALQDAEKMLDAKTLAK